jgi:ribonucleoside-diphosphate reductase alpha chain
MLSAGMAEARPRTVANGNGRRNTGNLCPQCGSATLVHQEGCKHCEGCGYNEC